MNEYLKIELFLCSYIDFEMRFFVIHISNQIGFSQNKNDKYFMKILGVIVKLRHKAQINEANSNNSKYS